MNEDKRMMWRKSEENKGRWACWTWKQRKLIIMKRRTKRSGLSRCGFSLMAFGGYCISVVFKINKPHDIILITILIIIILIFTITILIFIITIIIILIFTITILLLIIRCGQSLLEALWLYHFSDIRGSPCSCSLLTKPLFQVTKEDDMSFQVIQLPNSVSESYSPCLTLVPVSFVQIGLLSMSFKSEFNSSVFYPRQTLT